MALLVYRSPSSGKEEIACVTCHFISNEVEPIRSTTRCYESPVMADIGLKMSAQIAPVVDMLQKNGGEISKQRKTKRVR